MQTSVPTESEPKGGLSSEKREDIWALIIAAVVMLICVMAPAGVHHFFKDLLYLF